MEDEQGIPEYEPIEGDADDADVALFWKLFEGCQVIAAALLALLAALILAGGLRNG